MKDDQDVLNKWRALFRGQGVTPQLMEKAETLVDQLSQESPLRIRLGDELRDIRKLHNEVARKRR